MFGVPLTLGGTRQARQSRHAASESIGEDRPGSDAQLLSSTGGRDTPPAQWSSSVDITSVPARTWSATRTREAQIGRDLSRRRGARRSEPVTPPPTRSGAPTGVGSFEEVSSGTVVWARPELHPFG